MTLDYNVVRSATSGPPFTEGIIRTLTAAEKTAVEGLGGGANYLCDEWLDDHADLAAAIAALPAAGGVIGVKGGVWTFGTTSAAAPNPGSKNVVIKGMGRELSIIDGGGAACLVAPNDTFFKLEGVTLRNFSESAVRLPTTSGTTKIQSYFCRFENIGSSSVPATYSSRYGAFGTNGSGGSGVLAIDISFNEFEDCFAGIHARSNSTQAVRIQGNHFKNTEMSCVTLGDDPMDVDWGNEQWLIVDNICDTVQNAFAVTVPESHFIQILGCSDVLVDRNICKNNISPIDEGCEGIYIKAQAADITNNFITNGGYTEAAISFKRPATNVGGFQYLNKYRRNRISGNHIHFDDSVDNSRETRGIFIAAGADMTIESNVITGYNIAGIRVQTTARSTVRHNYVGEMQSYTGGSSADRAAIIFLSATWSGNNAEEIECSFNEVVDLTSTGNAYGIIYKCSGADLHEGFLCVGNKMRNLGASGNRYCIFVSGIVTAERFRITDNVGKTASHGVYLSGTAGGLDVLRLHGNDWHGIATPTTGTSVAAILETTSNDRSV